MECGAGYFSCSVRIVDGMLVIIWLFMRRCRSSLFVPSSSQDPASPNVACRSACSFVSNHSCAPLAVIKVMAEADHAAGRSIVGAHSAEVRPAVRTDDGFDAFGAARAAHDFDAGRWCGVHGIPHGLLVRVAQVGGGGRGRRGGRRRGIGGGCSLGVLVLRLRLRSVAERRGGAGGSRERLGLELVVSRAHGDGRRSRAGSGGGADVEVGRWCEGRVRIRIRIPRRSTRGGSTCEHISQTP